MVIWGWCISRYLHIVTAGKGSRTVQRSSTSSPSLCNKCFSTRGYSRILSKTVWSWKCSSRVHIRSWSTKRQIPCTFWVRKPYWERHFTCHKQQPGVLPTMADLSHSNLHAASCPKDDGRSWAINGIQLFVRFVEPRWCCVSLGHAEKSHA